MNLSVVKKYEVKTSSGDIETYDLGAEAANVTMSDGSDMETALGERAVFCKLSGSEDLNDIYDSGFYYVAYGQKCSNLPITTESSFGLEVVRATTAQNSWQTIYFTSTSKIYRRRCYATNTWDVWSELKFTDTTYSAATTSAAGLMSAADKTLVDNMQTYSTEAVQIGDWIDGSAVMRVCGSVAFSGLASSTDDNDISGVTVDTASVILRQNYWFDSVCFASYADFYKYASGMSGTVSYCVEYVK